MISFKYPNFPKGSQDCESQPTTSSGAGIPRPGRFETTIAGRLDLDLHPKTLKSILEQAGLMEIQR